MDESEKWDARLAYPLSYDCPPSFEVLPSLHYIIYLLFFFLPHFHAEIFYIVLVRCTTFLPFFPLLLFKVSLLVSHNYRTQAYMSPRLALDSVGWSRCIGTAIMEMPNLIPSITELHPQWLTNPPILECLRILCCGAHPSNIIALSPTLLRNPSHNASSMALSSPKGNLTTSEIHPTAC